MKIRTILSSGMLFIASFSFAQKKKNNDWNYISRDGYIQSDTIVKGEYSLIFVNKYPSFDTSIKKGMIETFFKVYPKQCKLYNKNSRKKVVLVIDPEYTAVAATAGETIRVNPQWMIKNPEDLDVVTHETMHIVQSYPGWSGPGWVTEGIADYVRATMGVNNEAAKWTLPLYKSGQNYDNAYRITARFFLWIRAHYKKDFVKKLDATMRNKTYSDAFWIENFGKGVQSLWGEYALNPTI